MIRHTGEPSGIYQERRDVPETVTDAKQNTAAINASWNFDAQLERIEGQALAVLRNEGYDGDWPIRRTFVAPDGTETLCFGVRNDDSPIVRDVDKAMFWLRELRRRLASGIDENALCVALRVGRMCERLGVRPHEHDALCGSKVHEGQRQGHRKTHGTLAEKQSRKERAVAMFNELHTKNPNMTRRAIDKIIANKLGLTSYRTVQGYRSGR